MVRSRQTMGQDWGGRAAANPKDAPKVTAAQVRAYAQAAGVEVRRDTGGWSQWWIRRPGDVWRTGWPTNFLMLQALQREYPAHTGRPGQPQQNPHPPLTTSI